MQSVRLKLIYAASFRPRQYALILLTCACTFIAIVMTVLRLLPPPHTRLHYLIAGTMPVCAGLVFARIWLGRKRLRLRKLAVRRVSAGGRD